LQGLDSLTFVTKLFNHELHLLARSDIQTVADLANKTVSIDQRGSGTAFTAMRIFDLLKIPVTTANDNPEAALHRLRKGEIAALALVAPKPVTLMQLIKNTEGLHLLSIPDATDRADSNYWQRRWLSVEAHVAGHRRAERYVPDTAAKRCGRRAVLGSCRRRDASGTRQSLELGVVQQRFEIAVLGKLPFVGGVDLDRLGDRGQRVGLAARLEVDVGRTAAERNLESGVLEAGCDPRGTKSEVFPSCALAI